MPTIEKTIEVDVPVSTAYTQWMQFEEFPSFMDGIDEVRQIDATHLHWVASVGGKQEDWDAEITDQVTDQRIAWKSTSGKDNAGVVTFHAVGDGRTTIRLEMEWESEGLLEGIGAMFGQDGRKVEGDLERFKTLVETQDTGMTRDPGATHAGTTPDPNLMPNTVGMPHTVETPETTDSSI